MSYLVAGSLAFVLLLGGYSGYLWRRWADISAKLRERS